MARAIELAYIGELGRELQRRRGKRSREDMVKPTPITRSAYTTYELGTRMMSVGNLVIVASALDTTPGEILTSVDLVAFADSAPMTVDLATLAVLADREIGYVARWARTTAHRGQTTARLSSGDIARLAALAGVPPERLAATVRGAVIRTA